MLADIYGPANLVREGRLPAARGRRQSGIPAAAGRRRAAGRRASAVLRASMSAAAPDGRWWVLGDRTQAPSGAGYALENRLALSRAHAGHLSRAPGRAARAVLPGVPGRAVGAQPPGRFARLPADARAAERDLFRARLSRALSRLPAGRGRRPDGARRRRVHPHRVRAEARRGAAAPPRCRLRRSAGTQRRARGSACPAWCRRCATARWSIANALGSGVVEARALLGFLPALAPARARARTWRCPMSRPGGSARPTCATTMLDRLDEHGDRVGVSGDHPGRRRSATACSASELDAERARAHRARRSPAAASISSRRKR